MFDKANATGHWGDDKVEVLVFVNHSEVGTDVCLTCNSNKRQVDAPAETWAFVLIESNFEP